MFCRVNRFKVGCLSKESQVWCILQYLQQIEIFYIRSVNDGAAISAFMCRSNVSSLDYSSLQVLLCTLSSWRVHVHSHHVFHIWILYTALTVISQISVNAFWFVSLLLITFSHGSKFWSNGSISLTSQLYFCLLLLCRLLIVCTMRSQIYINSFTQSSGIFHMVQSIGT